MLIFKCTEGILEDCKSLLLKYQASKGMTCTGQPAISLRQKDDTGVTQQRTEGQAYMPVNVVLGKIGHGKQTWFYSLLRMQIWY